MKQRFLCLKDWKMNNIVYFQKGKSYEGKPLKNNLEDVRSIKMKGESGLSIDFHSGSEYFNI